MAQSLNAAQQQAAAHLDGPVLAIAGAGTGKTHTLVHRLVNLVRSGVPAESILLLTFTRRAAEEMVSRASAILGGDEERASGGTFHSFANLTLRRYGRDIDVPPDFTILDQSDTFEILSGIRTDLKSAEPGLDLPRRETIGAVVSKAINRQAPIEDVVSEEYPQFFAVADYLEIAASRYESYKTERNLVDFDNLLVLLIRLLEESVDARSRIHHRYRYVMVDEYQDTNVLQARITHLLAGESQNIMVVGDDAQSIYAFRGANHRNLFDFKESFPDAALVTLEENYRSTQQVLDVANALMVQMTEAFRKHLVATRGEGPRPMVVECENEQEQAMFVAGEIERLQLEGTPLSEIAVLFRASRHAFALELELGRLGIPYVKYGGFRFMDSAHIKDVLAHLRLVENPGDDLSLGRVLLMRAGIGKKGARDIAKAVQGQSLVPALKSYRAKGKIRASLDEIAAFLSSIQELRGEPSKCLERAVELFDELIQARYDDWPRRKRDLETLVGLVGRYRSLGRMLSDLTLDPPTTARGPGLAASVSKTELVLSTLHSAKGLEWKAVFIIQARDGVLPAVSRFGAADVTDDDEDDDELDEDLRLLYVGVTRAKDVLYVTWPREMPQFRYGWPMACRFLERIPGEMFERTTAYELMS